MHERCHDCEQEFATRRKWRFVLHIARTIVWIVLLTMLLLLFALSTAGGSLALIPLLAYCGIPLVLFRLEMRARRRFLAQTGPRQLPTARLMH